MAIDFKHSKDRRAWNNVPVACDKEANATLRVFVRWVADLSELLGFGDITITSYWRSDDNGSYHSILQAADIRTKDKPYLWKIAFVMLKPIFSLMKPEIHINYHKELWGKAQEHIHLAIKNGAL